MASGTTYLTSDKTRLLTPHYFRGGNLPKVMQSTDTSNATFLTVNTPTGTFGFYVNANSSWAGLASQYGTNAVEYFAYFEINPEATYSRIQFQKKTLFKENVSISKELTVDNSIFTHNGIYMYGSSTSNVTDSLYFTKAADAGGATLTNSGTEYSYPTGPNIFPVRIYGYPARWKITYTDGVETEKTIYDSPSLWINIKSVKSSDLTATGYNEYYYLSSTNDRTSNGNYRIHSTKYLITVGQGGTGSNTSAFQSGGIIYYNGSKMVSNANLTTSGSNITIKATYYPLIYLEALSTNGASTYTRGYLEAGYDDKLVLWCDSDKTTTSKSRRGLAVYGYANKSDSKYALALRQCDTTGAWQADQYILTNGNWSNWITLSTIGAAAASHTHSYLPLGGGTLTGAVNTANNTWNKIGDDAQLGDINSAGCVGIQGLNGNTGLFFTTYNQTTKTTGGSIKWDGSHFIFSHSITANVTGTASGNMPWFVESSCDANSCAQGFHIVSAAITNAPTTNHGALLYVSSVGTPFQIFFPDNQNYVYKRWYTSGAWTSWQIMNAAWA